jgi:hypothetical protein
MARSRLVMTAMGLAAGLALITVGATGAQAALQASPAPAGPMFFGAELKGANEVPGPGDPDGRAVAVVRIQGQQVSYALAWRGLAAVTASHIHIGAAGTPGGVKVAFFGGALPANFTAVTGTVTVTDQALLDSIVADPAGFYANIHTTEFPGGAVRGQLRALRHPVDLQRFVQVGDLISVDTGDQEIAGGDPDGHAIAFVRASGGTVRFGFSFAGIAPPTAGHIHIGPVGVNGAVVVPFFAGALPASVNGFAGSVTGVDPKLVRAINHDPRGYYTNLHNGDFPGGAIRGQLFRVGGFGHDDALTLGD